MTSGQRRRATQGFTVVELSLICAVLGVLLAVAVPAFVRAMRVSKVSEAQHELARLYRRAAVYYATPQVIGGK
jgi:type IV pilus assembly protein PilA